MDLSDIFVADSFPKFGHLILAQKGTINVETLIGVWVGEEVNQFDRKGRHTPLVVRPLRV